MVMTKMMIIIIFLKSDLRDDLDLGFSESWCDREKSNPEAYNVS